MFDPKIYEDDPSERWLDRRLRRRVWGLALVALGAFWGVAGLLMWGALQ